MVSVDKQQEVLLDGLLKAYTSSQKYLCPVPRHVPEG